MSDNSTVIVSCGDISKTITLSDTPTEYTVVLIGCSDHHVKISGTGGKKRFYVHSVEIFNGDVNAKLKAPHREIVEVGDSTMRTVSGITDTCYTVKALAEGTFEYLVKAIYLDGTESPWSNIKHVTLTGISDVLVGDINEDGFVDVSDVTAVISVALGMSPVEQSVIDKCDLNDDGIVDVSDVTILISIALSSN